jgi:C-terminal processing protease CtpA/Prc
LSQLQRFTRYRQVPDSLRPFLDTWDRSFDDWGTAATSSTARPGYFRLIRSGDDTAGSIIRPAATRYTGRVFALVGADNSSATFEFALALRDFGLGTLVGQPTGGNQRGINGGAFYFLRLPSSKIEVDLPIIGFFAPSRRPNAGIAPDVTVRTSALDVARGRDPELDAIRRLIADVTTRRRMLKAGRLSSR